MDFIEGISKSEGWDTIFDMVDGLSEYNHFIGLKHTFSSPLVAAMFSREVMHFHGIPHSIVYECDKVFLSKFWTQLFK